MNRDQIKSLLLSSDRAVEHAMVTLLSLQTSEERQTSTTRAKNGQGFNAYHAAQGTYYANWIASGRKLTGRHLDKARKMAMHYVGQLEQVSEDKLRALTVHLVHSSFSLATVDPFQNETARSMPNGCAQYRLTG